MSKPGFRFNEPDIVAKMIFMYCRKHHRVAKALCPACSELLFYSKERIARCVFGPAKPVCARCTIHCYAKRRREEIRRVMRYSGPRILFYHPIIGLKYLVRKIFFPMPAARRR